MCANSYTGVSRLDKVSFLMVSFDLVKLETTNPTIARLVYNRLWLVIQRAGSLAELANHEIGDTPFRGDG